MNIITILPNPVIPHDLNPLDTNRVGSLHEETAGKALKYMQENRIQIAGFIIKSFTRSEQYSTNDKNGADFKVEFENRVTVPLQVKSCEHAKKKFERYGKIHKKYIPTIVVTGVEKVSEVVEKLTRLLSNAFKFFLRLRNNFNEHRQKRKQFRQMQSYSGCMQH